MIQLKSQREIEYMRASADLVGRTLGEVAKRIQPGVTTLALDQVAEEFIRDHGATPAFKGYAFGSLTPFPGTLCISVNDVVVHGFPSSRVLEEGDLVSVDCGAQLDGFFGDYAYTFAVGEVSDELIALCRTTHESLHKGIDKAVHGNRVGDIAYAVQSHCEAEGYGVVRDLVGHGIGRKLHEDPQVPNFGRRGTGRKLKAGTTICIEPMINRGTYKVTTDADGWAIRTADGEASAHYEHMVVVQRGEPEILSTFQYIEDVIEAPYHKAAMTHG
jgi:methionyl aminopeptidase